MLVKVAATEVSRSPGKTADVVIFSLPQSNQTHLKHISSVASEAYMNHEEVNSLGSQKSAGLTVPTFSNPTSAAPKSSNYTQYAAGLEEAQPGAFQGLLPALAVRQKALHLPYLRPPL